MPGIHWAQFRESTLAVAPPLGGDQIWPGRHHSRDEAEEGYCSECQECVSVGELCARAFSTKGEPIGCI